MKCHYCGNIVPRTTKFCAYCGTRLPNVATVLPSITRPSPSSQALREARTGIPTAVKWIATLAVISVVAIVSWALLGTTGGRIQPTPRPTPSYGLQWSFALNGQKAAVPIDLDSDGALDEIVVVRVGKPLAIYAITHDGSLKWSYEIEGSHSGHIPHHLAPIDYDSDGKYDEMLLDIRGNVSEPGVIVIGQPEVYTYNFFIIDSQGEQLWYYQCAQPEHAFLPGMSLRVPRCDAEEADALYEEKITAYGLNVGGYFIDQTYNRVDLDGDGEFDDIIQLREGGVEVLSKTGY